MDKEILLLTYAFRYSLDRHTCALQDVMEKYREIKDNFKVWQLKVWIKDIEYELGIQKYSRACFAEIVVANLTGVLEELKRDLKEKEC